MLANKQKNTLKPKNISNAAASVITGAVVGVGVAVAGIAAMRNDNNKAKAKKIIDEVKDKASSYMKIAQDHSESGKTKLEQTAAITDEAKKKVKKIWQKS